MNYTHQCIKCRTSYQDSDPDAYLCASCTAQRKALAAQVDAQFESRPRVQPVSALQEHERNGKTVNVNGRMVTFAKA